MDNVTTHGMRHAPNVQWSSSGNVIRNSRFYGSDGQWHAGWTVENMFENNLIVSETANGGNGHGLFASGLTSNAHGPQGPRNVVYHNDISSPKDAVYMMGGNENWLILHNRFIVEKGHAIVGKETSFDHVIEGNVFVLRDAQNPAVWFKTPDCAGIELIENTFYGAINQLAEIGGGAGELLVSQDNVVKELPASLPSMPAPEISSIFEWQREQFSRSWSSFSDSISR